MRGMGLTAVLAFALTGASVHGQAVWSSKSSYPVRGGNQVQIMVDGETAFAAIARSIEQARSYVYVTFAFVTLDFRPVPSDRRTIRDRLVEAAARGVDVRAVVWNPTAAWGHTWGEGTPVPPGVNAGPGSMQVRWDTARGLGIYPAKIGCHHQKSFMMDSPAGDLAYVGGMNSYQGFWDTSAHAFAEPGRTPDGEGPEAVQPLHDVFASIHGPACADVIANFRERYNQATFPHRDATRDLAPPAPADAAAEAPDQETQVQIVRTIAPKTYPSLPAGERSIQDAYVQAIRSAQRLIYIENQYVFDKEVVAALHDAARRGVRVIALLTHRPNGDGKLGLVLRLIESLRSVGGSELEDEDRVALYSPVITTTDASGKVRYRDIYVHAKDMIVDDRFVTLGSSNLSTMSTQFHSELNLVLNDPAAAQDLRARLWAEHLQLDHVDPAVLADPAAGFLLWKQHAEANVKAWKAGAKPLSRVFPLKFFTSWSAAH